MWRCALGSDSAGSAKLRPLVTSVRVSRERNMKRSGYRIALDAHPASSVILRRAVTGLHLGLWDSYPSSRLSKFDVRLREGTSPGAGRADDSVHARCDGVGRSAVA